MTTQYSDAQLTALITALTQSVSALTRATGASHGGGAASSGHRSSNLSAFDTAAMDDVERQLRLNSKNMTAQNRLLKDSTAAFKNLLGMAGKESRELGGDKKQLLKKERDKISRSTEGLKETQDKLTIEYTKLVRLSLPQQAAAFKNLVKGTTGLSNNFSVVQRNSSLMNAALISRAAEINSDPSSAEHARYVAQLTDASKILRSNDMTKSILTAMNLVDEAADEFNNNLMPDDFSQLRLRLGEASVKLGDAFFEFSKMSGKSIEDMLGTGILQTYKEQANNDGAQKEMHASILATFENLKSLKIALPPDIEAILEQVKKGQHTGGQLSDEITRLATVLDDFYKSTSQTSAHLFKIAKDANNSYSAIQRKFFSIEGIKDTANDKLGELTTYAGTVAALKKTADALLAVLTEASGFNIAHIAASFMDVQKQSIAMGMSFEEASKFMQDNKRVMGIYGADSFKSLRGGFETAFNEFGYTFKQGADMIAPAMEAAISSGVNVRDSNALNDHMRKTMDSFSKLAGLVNISAAEYASLNSELLGSDDVMKNMLGMTAEQSQAYADSLTLQRDELYNRGISLQLAQEVIKAQEAEKRAKVRDKFEGGAKLMAQMGLLGFSAEEQMRAFTLATKGRKLTDAETEEYNKLKERVGLQREVAVENAPEGGHVYSILAGIEATMPTSEIETSIQSMLGLSVSAKAKSDIKDDEADRSALDSKPNQNVMYLTEIRETITSILTNTLATAAGLAAVSIGALAYSSTIASKSLLALGGVGGAGSLLSGLGKMGGGLLLKGGLGAVALGGATGVMMNGYDSKTDSGLLHVLSQAGMGAVSGAGAGAMFGGLHGAGIGAGIGLVTGLGKGIYDVYSSPASPNSQSIGNPEQSISETINKAQTETGIIQVSDAGAQSQLAQITQILNEAVRLLTMIAPKDAAPFRTDIPNYARRSIPQAVDAIR
jgi:hypothetical protein